MDPRRRRRVIRALGHLAMAATAIAMVSPILVMLATSIKPESEVLADPGRLIPQRPTLENYAELFGRSADFPVGRWLLNSVGISLTATVLVLLVASTAAFAFSRLQWKGRDTVFLVVVATMMLPAQVSLIPVFLIVQSFGWFNSYAGLVIPGLAGAFGVFLLRQFFLAIPVELEEAAYMDGATPWVVYWRVVLPIGKPALATLAVFTFMGSWNDFVWPLIITSDVNMRTLPVGLTIFQGQFVSEYGITMAAAALTTLPMLVAFLIFQKRITEGIALTGLKG